MCPGRRRVIALSLVASLTGACGGSALPGAAGRSATPRATTTDESAPASHSVAPSAYGGATAPPAQPDAAPADRDAAAPPAEHEAPSSERPANLDEAERDLAAAARLIEGPDERMGGDGRSCEISCKALESMRRAADRICELDPGGEPPTRCQRARDRVALARDRVLRACKSCAG